MRIKIKVIFMTFLLTFIHYKWIIHNFINVSEQGINAFDLQASVPYTYWFEIQNPVWSLLRMQMT